MSSPTLIPWDERLSRAWRPPLRVVYFGSPEFSVPALQRAMTLPELQVVGVVTQPDRPAGRGHRLTPPPVAKVASESGLPLVQPERLEHIRDQIVQWRPDLLVVAAFGKIFPRWLLELASVGPVNLHASLLPRHRGPAPVQAAILAGDQTTGVCLMGMEPAMDSGPVLWARSIAIGETEDAGSLTKRLSKLSADVLAEGVGRIIAGQCRPQAQNDAAATYAAKIGVADAVLDWQEDAAALARRVRAMAPSPGARTTWQGKPLKILAARAQDGAPGVPGTVVASNTAGVEIACGRGHLVATVLQRPGGRALAVEEFLRGHPIGVGQRMGL